MIEGIKSAIKIRSNFSTGLVSYLFVSYCVILWSLVYHVA